MNFNNISLLRVAAFCLTLLIASCSNAPKPAQSTAQNQPEQPENEIVIKRYEQKLFAIDKHNIRNGLSALYPEYAFFLGNEWRDTMNVLRIYNFINDPNIAELYNLSQQKYPNLDVVQKDLNKAFSKFLTAYPEKKLPKVFSYVSGLDVENPVYYFDTAMAIGLDMFLGNDVEAYQKAGLPKYKIIRYTPYNLLPSCMQAVAYTLIKTDDNQSAFLDQAVAAGKMLYFLDYTLPDVDDYLKIGYTPEHMKWAVENESQIWSFIIDQQMLFSTDQQAITKMFTDAPFTSGLPQGSPSRLGAYIGWQIVKAYMAEASETTLKQLMEETDARKILKVSGFKPGKR